MVFPKNCSYPPLPRVLPPTITPPLAGASPGFFLSFTALSPPSRMVAKLPAGLQTGKGFSGTRTFPGQDFAAFVPNGTPPVPPCVVF